jgi:hypothetical protein
MPERIGAGPVFTGKGAAYSFAAVVLFVSAGIWATSGSYGIEATRWMLIHTVDDFSSAGKVADFVANLRIPIPIVLSLLEITSYRLFGSTYIVTHLLYRFALVFSYVLVICFFAKSRNRVMVSAFISFLFLWATVLIHPGSPQMYDVLFPFFNLLFVVSLAHVGTDVGTPRARARVLLLCLLAGFSLSMFELLRPFVFLLLPFPVLCAFQALRGVPARYFACFLLPLVLISGSWHAYIAVRHGQATWSNHTGFNLIRAWPMVEPPPLVPESNDLPVVPGREPNLNTKEHAENSRILQASILEFIVTHPRESAENIAYRMYEFLKVPTQLHFCDPPYPEIQLYRILVWLGFLSIVLNLLQLGAVVVESRSLESLGEPVNILSCSTFLYVVLMAIGESGEEPRFLISVLPMIAAVLAGFDTGRAGSWFGRVTGCIRQGWRTNARGQEDS